VVTAESLDIAAIRFGHDSSLVPATNRVESVNDCRNRQRLHSVGDDLAADLRCDPEHSRHHCSLDRSLVNTADEEKVQRSKMGVDIDLEAVIAHA
jgi:hypothetical protein